MYGITYGDNNSCCVFNGSDLHWDKRYAAKGIADRMRANQEDEDKLSNKNWWKERKQLQHSRKI